jgi:hypothetical protein
LKGNILKLQTNSTSIEISGNNDSSQFSIAMNGKAFRVLSDTLYKNKIGSIVRELSCNAHDAHVMAGKQDVPFTLHLPDAFEPWFSVQDKGVGLSPKDITSVFTVYFQSTKDNNNDAIGAFGLGAKTPFSYTDQFSVTSVKDGKKYIYSAYITESGVPSISEMHSEDTTEENGVEIKMSVKQQDFRTFRTEVENQLRFFKVKPAIENGDATFAQFGNVVFDTDYGTIHNRSYSVYPAIYIVQGNVGYIVDRNEIKNNISAEANAYLHLLHNYDVILRFNIGEIGVTASREGVEYNATTCKNIEQKITNLKKSVIEQFDEKLKKFPTVWEKVAYVNTDGLMQTLGKYPDGVKIDGGYMVSNLALPDVKIIARSTMRRSAPMYSYSVNKAGVSQYNFKIRIDSKKDVKFVIKDSSTMISAKYRQLYAGFNGVIYEITPYDGFDLEEFKKSIGGYDEFIKASEVILPPAVKKKYTRSNYYKYCAGASVSIRSWTREPGEDIEDIEEETLYVEVKDGSVVDMDSIRQYNAVSYFEEVPELIAIREADIAEAESNSNLIPLKDYIENKIKEYNVNSSLKKKYLAFDAATTYQNSLFYQLFNDEFVKQIKKLAVDSEINKLYNALHKAKLRPKMTDKEVKICQFMGWDRDKQKLQQRRYSIARNFVNKLEKKYPLLRVALSNSYSNNTVETAAAQYVALINKE